MWLSPFLITILLLLLTLPSHATSPRAPTNATSTSDESTPPHQLTSGGMNVHDWHSFLWRSPYTQQPPSQTRRTAHTDSGHSSSSVPLTPSSSYSSFTANKPSSHPHHILLQIGNLHVDESLQQAHLQSMHAVSERLARRTEKLEAASESIKRLTHQVKLSSGMEIELELPSLKHIHHLFHEQQVDSSSAVNTPIEHARQWMVHLKPPITERVTSELNAIIAPYQLGTYLPHHAFLLVAPESVVLKLKELVESADPVNETDAPPPLSARILLLAALPSEAKFQSNLLSEAQRVQEQRYDWLRQQWDKNSDRVANPNGMAEMEQELSSFIEKIQVELRVHCVFPTFSNGPLATLNAHNVHLTYPSHQLDTKFLESLLQQFQHQHPSNHPSAASVTTETVDATQFIIRIPRRLSFGHVASKDQQQFEQLFQTWTEGLLAASTYVHYIEVHMGPSFTTSNKFTRYVVQSDPPETSGLITDVTKLNVYNIGLASQLNSHAYPDAAYYPSSSSVNSSRTWLHGENQILTIGDTGLDYDSCFYHDPAHPVPWNSVNHQHRKIVSYVSSDTSPVAGYPSQPGDYDGHGTHTTGTLAGEVMNPSDIDSSIVSDAQLASLANYNGLAYGAKLAIFDFQEKASSFQITPGLVVPTDIYHEYYNKSRQLGSFISSNSWGTDQITGNGYGSGDGKISGHYESYSQGADSFAYDFQDYLIVFAAGNDGHYGLGNIGFPGLAKNILTVGSSRSSSQSFFEYNGANIGMKITPAAQFQSYYPSLSLLYEGVNVQPAADGFGPIYHQLAQQTQGVCLALPTDACTPLLNPPSCTGGVLLVDRGNCSFSVKATQVQHFGASLFVVMNSDTTDAVFAVSPDGVVTETITVPTVMIPYSLGAALKSFIQFEARADSSTTDLQFTFPYAVSDEYNSEHISWFSSHGPTFDHRIKPEVVAPGEYVMSMATTKDLTDFQCGQDQVNGSSNPFPKTLALKQGTSMAAPLTAASAALITQYLQEGWYLDPFSGERRLFNRPSSALLKGMLINSAQALGGLIHMLDQTLYGSSGDSTLPVTSVPSFEQGYGRIELDRVLSFPGAHFGPGLFVDDYRPIQAGEIGHYCFLVNSTANGDGTPKEFKVTLTWTDPLSTISSGILLVNNLDLIVIQTSPSGVSKTFIGNSPINSAEPDWDITNNVEQVSIPSSLAIAGSYSILIRGTNIPIPIGQNFSLVVNGAFYAGTTNNDNLTGCPVSVFCPNDCSGHGRCFIDSNTASATNTSTYFLPSSIPSTINTNSGICLCNDPYVGADCSVLATTLSPLSPTASFHIQSESWTYVAYPFNPKFDLNVTITMTVSISVQSGTTSDPDLYVLMPSVNTSKSISSGGLNYPTLLHYTYSDAGVTPTITGQKSVAVHTMVIPWKDLQAAPTGTIMIGIYGYCCGQSSVQLQLTLVRATFPTSSTGASSSSSTGGGFSSSSSSTGISSSKSPTFDLSYSAYSYTLRLLVSYDTISSNLVDFTSTLQHQIQTGLGLTSYVYDTTDTISFKLNRILIQTIVDSTILAGSSSSSSSSTGGSASNYGRDSIQRPYDKDSVDPIDFIQPLDSIGIPAITITFLILPSIHDSPTTLSPSSSIPSGLVNSTSSNLVDLLSTPDLLARLNQALHNNPVPPQVIQPSTTFTSGGSYLNALDLFYTPIQTKLVVSYCSSFTNSTSLSTPTWISGPCFAPISTSSSSSTGVGASIDTSTSSTSWSLLGLSQTEVIIIGVTIFGLIIVSVLAILWCLPSTPYLDRIKRFMKAKQAALSQPPPTINSPKHAIPPPPSPANGELPLYPDDRLPFAKGVIVGRSVLAGAQIHPQQHPDVIMEVDEHKYPSRNPSPQLPPQEEHEHSESPQLSLNDDHAGMDGDDEHELQPDDSDDEQNGGGKAAAVQPQPPSQPVLSATPPRAPKPPPPQPRVRPSLAQRPPAILVPEIQPYRQQQLSLSVTPAPVVAAASSSPKLPSPVFVSASAPPIARSSPLLAVIPPSVIAPTDVEHITIHLSDMAESYHQDREFQDYHAEQFEIIGGIELKSSMEMDVIDSHLPPSQLKLSKSTSSNLPIRPQSARAATSSYERPAELFDDPNLISTTRTRPNSLLAPSDPSLSARQRRSVLPSSGGTSARGSGTSLRGGGDGGDGSSSSTATAPVTSSSSPNLTPDVTPRLGSSTPRTPTTSIGESSARTGGHHLQPINVHTPNSIVPISHHRPTNSISSTYPGRSPSPITLNNIQSTVALSGRSSSPTSSSLLPLTPPVGTMLSPFANGSPNPKSRLTVHPPPQRLISRESDELASEPSHPSSISPSSPPRPLSARRLGTTNIPNMTLQLVMCCTILCACITTVSASAAAAVAPIGSPSSHSSGHILIIGAGLAGLTVAYELLRDVNDTMTAPKSSSSSSSTSTTSTPTSSTTSSGRPQITILEARSRIGGRILSLDGNLDLGASWHWSHQKHVARLVKELGLTSFLDNEKERSGHGARVIGGNQAIINALWAVISKKADVTLQLNAVVTAIHQEGSKRIKIHLQDGTSFLGDVGVLAIPPRLAMHSIKFQPSLPNKLIDSFSSITTWMASTTKVILTFSEPFWLKSGLPNRRFQEEPIYEWHQACSTTDHYERPIHALFGFGGPGVLEVDVLKQLRRCYGAKFHEPLSYTSMDWSSEPFTSVTNEDGAGDHPHTTQQERQSLWSGRLYLASTEMASEDGGYMNGAILRGQDVAQQIQAVSR